MTLSRSHLAVPPEMAAPRAFEGSMGAAVAHFDFENRTLFGWFQPGYGIRPHPNPFSQVWERGVNPENRPASGSQPQTWPGRIADQVQARFGDSGDGCSGNKPTARGRVASQLSRRSILIPGPFSQVWERGGWLWRHSSGAHTDSARAGSRIFEAETKSEDCFGSTCGGRSRREVSAPTSVGRSCWISSARR
jgi:hypothetical protein